jgi:hypothetical protein
MKDKIKQLLEKTRDIEDEELQSHFLNYICVLISSYLEKELKSILKEYEKTAHFKRHECKDNIKNIKIHNAKWCSIRPIIMNIDAKIFDQLRNNINNFSRITDSIDNIVKTRHKIAHGDNVATLTKEILIKNLSDIDCFIIELKKYFPCVLCT